MTRNAWSILLAGILLALAAWCYFNFDVVAERAYVGFSGEAARNPMLALERFVERMGSDASVIDRAADLDNLPDRATLILAHNRYGMTPQRMAKLLRWIENGGRLVVEAEPLGRSDVLLSVLGVTRKAGGGARDGARVTLQGYDRAFKVVLAPMELTGGLSKSYTAPLADGATALLQFGHGRGNVVVLPSFWFMNNHAIATPDHAAFAWAVIRFPDGAGRAPSRVLIAPQFERPSLAAWLWNNALPALIATAVLLALWLARAVRRFGPIVPPHGGSRRRLLDHLRASGRFEWSAHAAARLLAAAREGCLANIAKARPTLAYLDPAQQSARYAELTGLPLDQVELALGGDATTPRAFTAAVQTLQTIEEKLARRAGA